MKHLHNCKRLWCMFTGTSLACVLAFCLSLQPAYCDEAVAEDAATEQELLEIPEGDAAELLQFMQGLFRIAPPENASREEQMAHRNKVMWTMVKAADVIQDREPSEQQLLSATQYKFMTLRMLAYSDEQARTDLAEAAEKARLDDNPKIAALGLESYVSSQAEKWGRLSEEEREALLQVIAEARQDDRAPVANSGFQALVSLATNNWGQLSDEVKQEAMDVINEARHGDDPQKAQQGLQAYISLKAGSWLQLSDDEKETFANELMPSDTPSENDAMAIQLAVRNFERRDSDFVKELLNKALPKLLEAEDESIRESAEQLQGIARRMNLPGNKMELTGTLLDGTEFDWESYRGKVVLVDFWAVWCGPCRAEVPNILAKYKAYHEKGFDVVGISLDNTPEDAQKYIDEMGIPWGSIFPTEEGDRGWKNPMARYYGITGIPTAILVDKDGKVIHMNARGPVLGEQLEKLLGAPVEADESKPAA